MSIGRIERVTISLSLPLVSVHIDVSKAIMLSLPQVGLLGSRTLNILHFKYISHGYSSSFLGSGIQ
jgi:hypothetical protein